MEQSYNLLMVLAILSVYLTFASLAFQQMLLQGMLSPDAMIFVPKI